MRILFEGVRVSQMRFSAPDGVKEQSVSRTDTSAALREAQTRTVK